MPTLIPPTEVEVCGSGATPNKGASRETFRKWIKAYLNLFGASGTPDGALTALGVIQTVTNANGTATKFFDGTMICSHSMALAFINASNISTNWTYPVAFVGIPKTVSSLATVNLITTKAVTGSGCYGGTNVNVIVGVFSLSQFVTGDATGEVMHGHAIGRWKA